MFIDQLNEFLKDASRFPAPFWSFNYFLARRSFLEQIESVAVHTHKGTETKESLDRMIYMFKAERLDEKELAENLCALSSVFSLSKMQNKKLKIFEELSARFLERAKTFQLYDKKRLSMKKSLPIEEQKAFDTRLFQLEGINYCLEYYLAVFKILGDKKTKKEKEEFIKTKEINLGFGGVPGLTQDFTQDESLAKFILIILDDQARERLVMNYYRFKIILEEEKDIILIERAFGRFIFSLLELFEKRGIEELTSRFLKPYGEKPSISNLLALFKHYGD